LSYPDAPRIVVPPPGPRSRELLDIQSRFETDAVVYSKYFPIAVNAAQGSTIEDVDGNRFIDWVAGVSVLNLGHRHPRLVAALEKQMQRVWHALELPTEARIEFLRELEEVLPGRLKRRAKMLFTVTGGDAVETAVNLADQATGRHGVVTFSGAYHGVHGGAVNLTSGRRYHATTAFHGGTVVRVPFPDPYRPVLNTRESSAGVIAYLEHLVRDPSSGVDQLSAVLVEPILGEGGYVVPPDDFLPSLREFCDAHELLLIVDEIQTGLGRTGRMWAVEHSRVTPDILCIAKSIGGGIPVSMIAYRDDLVPELPKGFHIGTYRGNPLALAVGTEVIRILREEDWIERTARRGRTVLERFQGMQQAHAGIGHVRGKGFMIGVEFVRNAHTREPWPERARAMRHELFRRGLLMHTCGAYDQCLRFMAPLTIEDALLERGLTLFEDALTGLEGTLPPPRSVPPIAGHHARPAGSERLPEPRLPPLHPETGPSPSPHLEEPT
jgi:4-aminobutyrate aminotransferase